MGENVLKNTGTIFFMVQIFLPKYPVWRGGTLRWRVLKIVSRPALVSWTQCVWPLVTLSWSCWAGRPAGPCLTLLGCLLNVRNFCLFTNISFFMRRFCHLPLEFFLTSVEGQPNFGFPEPELFFFFKLLLQSATWSNFFFLIEFKVFFLNNFQIIFVCLFYFISHSSLQKFRFDVFSKIIKKILHRLFTII